MYTDTTGIILSGGKSSRMGSDKALLKVGSETIIERITNLMNSIFSDVFIVTNTPEEYKFLNIPLYEDIHKHKGPLSGIHSGLVHSLTDKNFFISCDMPLISKELINHIVEFISDKSIRYCFADRCPHYLAGVYSKDLILEIEKIIASNSHDLKRKTEHFSIRNLIFKVEAEIINVEHLSFYSENLFFNLNTTKDFEKLENILSPQ